jgi:hypothetical protein
MVTPQVAGIGSVLICDAPSSIVEPELLSRSLADAEIHPTHKRIQQET